MEETRDLATASLLPNQDKRRGTCNACTASLAASVVLCLLLAALAFRYLKAPPFDVLFVLHDAGESLFVMRALQTLAGESLGGAPLRIAVLALGEPAHSLFAGATNVTVHTPAMLGVTTPIVDGYDRNATLSSIDQDLLLARLGRPSVVVVGTAYKMQAQLSAAFRSRAPQQGEMLCYSVGIDDSIGGDWSAQSVIARDFLNGHEVLDEVFVADRATQRNATSYVDRHQDGRVAVTLTGSGTLEAWREAAHNATAVARARDAMVRAPGRQSPPTTRTRVHTCILVYAHAFRPSSPVAACHTHTLAHAPCACVPTLSPN